MTVNKLSTLGWFLSPSGTNHHLWLWFQHLTDTKENLRSLATQTADFCITSKILSENASKLITNQGQFSCGTLFSQFTSNPQTESENMYKNRTMNIQNNLTYYRRKRLKQANLLWSGPTWVYLYSPWIFSFWKYWFRRALAFSNVQFPWSPAFKSTSSDSKVCWTNDN